MIDIVSDQHREICWICGGSGRAELLAGLSTQICAMCDGSGLVASVPTTTSEMVTAMLALPHIRRRQLTAEDLRQIDALEEIVRACLAEMHAEG